MSLGFGSLEYQGVLDETSSKYAQYFLLESSRQGWEGAESPGPGHSSVFQTWRQPLMCEAVNTSPCLGITKGPFLGLHTAQEDCADLFPFKLRPTASPLGSNSR